jgi:HlyD family secretion protein
VSGRQKGTALTALGIAVLLAVYIPLTGALANRGGADVPIYRVERQDFVHRVPAQGNLKAAQATPVSVPVGAPGPFRIAWLAADGALVRSGEVVVRFDPTDAEKRLRDAEDDLRSARLRLDKERVTGNAELVKLEHDAAMARMELENARQFQKKDQVIFSRHDIIESEIDGTLAQEREKQARAARRTQSALSGTEQELLGIEMRQADSKIQQARQALASLEVKAPHDGVLVLSRDWRGNPTRIGDTVWNGQPLAEIPELARMQAEVFVLEADAGGLAPGKPATVALESAPDTPYQARIARVDSLARPRMRGSPVQYFSVMLDLGRTEPALMKPGQRVQASLLLEERKGALAVPRQAIFERDGKTVVYRRAAGSVLGFEPVPVKLGPSGMGRVVVESGLQAGDEIALADPARTEETAKKPEEGAKAPAGPPRAPLP